MPVHCRNKIQYVIVVNEGKGKVMNVGVEIGKDDHLGQFKVNKKWYKTVGGALDDLKKLPIIASDGSKIFLRKVATASSFYAGQMPREECEAFVKKAAHGDYLIREKSDGQSYVLVINNKGGVMNMVIKRDADGKYQGEDTLELLLRKYKKQDLKSKKGDVVPLGKPAKMVLIDDIRADINFGLVGTLASNI